MWEVYINKQGIHSHDCFSVEVSYICSISVVFFIKIQVFVGVAMFAKQGKGKIMLYQKPVDSRLGGGGSFVFFKTLSTQGEQEQINSYCIGVKRGPRGRFAWLQ